MNFSKLAKYLNINAAFMKNCHPTRVEIMSDNTSDKIYIAQIDTLYHQTLIVLIVNIVNSSLVALLLVSYMGQTLWLIFLALTFLLTALRMIG